MGISIKYKIKVNFKKILVDIIFSILGMRFGMIQTKVGIITVIKDFSLSMDARTKLPVELAPSSVITLAKENIFLKVSTLW